MNIKIKEYIGYINTQLIKKYIVGVKTLKKLLFNTTNFIIDEVKSVEKSQKSYTYKSAKGFFIFILFINVVVNVFVTDNELRKSSLYVIVILLPIITALLLLISLIFISIFTFVLKNIVDEINKKQAKVLFYWLSVKGLVILLILNLFLSIANYLEFIGYKNIAYAIRSVVMIYSLMALIMELVIGYRVLKRLTTNAFGKLVIFCLVIFGIFILIPMSFLMFFSVLAMLTGIAVNYAI